VQMMRSNLLMKPSELVHVYTGKLPNDMRRAFRHSPKFVYVLPPSFDAQRVVSLRHLLPTVPPRVFQVIKVSSYIIRVLTQ